MLAHFRSELVFIGANRRGQAPSPESPEREPFSHFSGGKGGAFEQGFFRLSEPSRKDGIAFPVGQFDTKNGLFQKQFEVVTFLGNALQVSFHGCEK